jgi:hypothetical protein
MLACLVALGAALAGGVTHAQVPPVTTPITTPTTTTTTPATTTTSTSTTTTSTTTTTMTTPTDLGDPPPSLGLSVNVAPGVITPLAPGSTGTASGVLAVTAGATGWTLKAADASSTSPSPGHLLRSACSTGASVLSSALEVTATPSAGTGSSAGAKALTGSAATIASGTGLASVVTTSFRQSVGTSEVVTAGCAYTISIVYTLVG